MLRSRHVARASYADTRRIPRCDNYLRHSGWRSCGPVRIAELPSSCLAEFRPSLGGFED